VENRKLKKLFTNTSEHMLRGIGKQSGIRAVSPEEEKEG